MSSRFDLIAEQLLQKPLAECTIPELQQLIEQFPFLAPAHFLLAKKLENNGSADAKAQWQKAALYYHQPAAFEAFLNSDLPDLYQPTEIEEPEETENTDNSLQWQNCNEEDLGQVEMQHEPEQTQVVIATPHVEPSLDVEDKTEEPEPHFIQEPLPIATPEGQAQLTPAATEQHAMISLPAEGEDKGESTLPQEQQDGLPAFEPFHTIDYFASQGIKLSQEEATQDKMGKQLKSFTQWLKTMKRLPASEQLQTLDAHSEHKVESLAAHSVADTEIVTEAMAEVWLKQGNREKAAEVYRKLSLSNSSKRAYFAAKLESLKKNV